MSQDNTTHCIALPSARYQTQYNLTQHHGSFNNTITQKEHNTTSQNAKQQEGTIHNMTSKHNTHTQARVTQPIA